MTSDHFRSGLGLHQMTSKYFLLELGFKDKKGVHFSALFLQKKRNLLFYDHSYQQLVDQRLLNISALPSSNGQMASEQFGSGPELQLMTPKTISLGLVHNPSSSTPNVPPTKKDWDILFQPIFDEYFNPPSNVVSRGLPVVAPQPADTTGTPLSTSIEQDALAVSTSSTLQETQSPVISEGVEEQLQPTQFDNDPFLDILTSNPSS
ncbi:hypothetical protein Tco_0529605 [Tanacetum coccineum]